MLFLILWVSQLNHIKMDCHWLLYATHVDQFWKNTPYAFSLNTIKHAIIFKYVNTNYKSKF